MCTLTGTKLESGGTVGHHLPGKYDVLCYLQDSDGGTSDSYIVRNAASCSSSETPSLIVASEYLNEEMLFRYGVRTVRSIESTAHVDFGYKQEDRVFFTNERVHGFKIGYRELNVTELEHFNVSQKERYYELLHKTYSGIVNHQLDVYTYGGLFNTDLRPPQLMFGTLSPEQDIKEEGEFFIVDNDPYIAFYNLDPSTTRDKLENMDIPIKYGTLFTLTDSAREMLLMCLGKSYVGLTYWTAELDRQSDIGGKFFNLLRKLENLRLQLSFDERKIFQGVGAEEDTDLAKTLLSLAA